MSGLPPKLEKEANNGEDTSHDELIRLDPYHAFNLYFHEKDDKGSRKATGEPGLIEAQRKAFLMQQLERGHKEVGILP
ncbi:Phytosulfokines 5 [Hordeum vulgare]|nr:Phytosulfokines 5 [Hordeum vulgare]